MSKTVQPVTPGELLYEEFMLPMGITKYRLAKDIGVSATRIGEIVAGKRSITADTDLRLAKYFGLSKGYWLRSQALFDIEVEEVKISEQLAAIEPHLAKVAKCCLPASCCLKISSAKERSEVL